MALGPLVFVVFVFFNLDRNNSPGMWNIQMNIFVNSSLMLFFLGAI